MSSDPKRSTVAATHASACSGSPALAANTSTSPSIRPAASSSASCLRELSMTDAPEPARFRATASPTPRDAPVTSATLPSSRISMPATVGEGGAGERGEAGPALGHDPALVARPAKAHDESDEHTGAGGDRARQPHDVEPAERGHRVGS